MAARRLGRRRPRLKNRHADGHRGDIRARRDDRDSATEGLRGATQVIAGVEASVNSNVRTTSTSLPTCNLASTLARCLAAV